MKKVAETLRSQARLLRGIGDDNELKGKYTDKLREESGGLEQRLNNVADRYEGVHGHLTNWANDLEGFQSEADKILSNAKKEQDEEAAKPKGKAESASSGDGDDPYEKYRGQLETLVYKRNSKASEHAGKIRDQLGDSIEDGFWDDVGGAWNDVATWIKDNADWIKIVLDALGWIATVLGVIALFIPGLNVLVLVLGAIILGARLLMAAAGAASWTEVIMDSVGLLTMGIGRAGLTALKGANSITKAAASLQRTGGLKAGLRAHKSMMDDLQRAVANSSGATKQFYKDLLDFTRKKISGDAGRVVRDLPQMSRGTKLALLGDDEAAALYSQFSRNAQAFPEAAVGLAGKAKVGYGASLAAIYVGAGTDVVDKVFGQSDAWSALSQATDGFIPDKPSSDSYNEWKENSWMAPIGANW